MSDAAGGRPDFSARDDAYAERVREATAQTQEVIDKFEQSGQHEVITPELKRVLKEITSVGFSNIVDLFETNAAGEVAVIAPHQLPRHVAAGIKSVKIKRRVEGTGDTAREFEVMEFVLYDKLVALEKLMRYHGGYAKEHEKPGSSNDEALELIMEVTATRGMAPPSPEAGFASPQPIATDYSYPDDEGLPSEPPEEDFEVTDDPSLW